ncbi:hypothetical protein ACWGMA_05595 [Streptomyces asiaticus]
MLGDLGPTDDGRWALRFERRIDHPQKKVWRAISESTELRGWFAHILDYDRFRIDLVPVGLEERLKAEYERVLS